MRGMSKRESGPGGGKAAKIESLSLQIQELEKTISWSTAIGLSLAAATAVVATICSRMATAKAAEPRRDYRQPQCSIPAREPEREPVAEPPPIAAADVSIEPPASPLPTFDVQPPSVEQSVPAPEAGIQPFVVTEPEPISPAEELIPQEPPQDTPIFVEAAPTAEIVDAEPPVSESPSEEAVAKERNTEELLLKIEELRKQNLALELQLEKERELRLAFEKSLAPRILPRTSNDRGIWNFAPLTRFRGTSAIVRYLPDAEATRAASELVDTLKASGWEIVRASPDPQLWSEFLDGVIVESSGVGLALRSEEGVSYGPSSTLLDFLHASGWAARTFENASDIPPGVVQISVGFKPSPYRPTIGTADDPAAVEAGVLRGSQQDDLW
jgi:hypothetical protein